MADVKDITSAIHAALEEIGVSGKLSVRMAEQCTAASMGQSGTGDLDISVEIESLDQTKEHAT